MPVSSELGFEMVKFVVGNEHVKTFYVHSKLLCKRSPYFERIFGGGITEGAMAKGIFPVYDIDAFKLLLSWIYKDRLEAPVIELESSEGFRKLLSLFVLAEKLEIHRLADTVMDIIDTYCRHRGFLPSPRDLTHAYKRTHSDSVLRLWISRLCAVQILDQIPDNPLWSNNELKVIFRDNIDLFSDTMDNVQIKARYPPLSDSDLKTILDNTEVFNYTMDKLRVQMGTWPVRENMWLTHPFANHSPCEYHQHAGEICGYRR
jgi:hypothetical protein